jgi:hypothetical protein
LFLVFVFGTFFSTEILGYLFTFEIEKVKQLIEKYIDSNCFQMTKHENSMFVTIEGNRRARRKTLRQQTSSGELFCVYRNLRSFFHSAFDLFAAFISISFMTIFAFFLPLTAAGN